MKTNTSKKPTDVKVRYGKCSTCTTKTPSTLLYVVLDKRVCLSCGNKEIEKWNRWVKDAKVVRL